MTTEAKKSLNHAYAHIEKAIAFYCNDNERDLYNPENPDKWRDAMYKEYEKAEKIISDLCKANNLTLEAVDYPGLYPMWKINGREYHKASLETLFFQIQLVDETLDKQSILSKGKQKGITWQP